VAVTWLLTLRMRRRRWGGLWLVWGGLVALSTLTVKQHFIADVVGGIALATAPQRLDAVPQERGVACAWP
jgi:membrane-associated phospholipid phosphatase